MGDGTLVAISFCGSTNSGVVCMVKVCVPLYDTKTRAWKCAPCRYAKCCFIEDGSGSLAESEDS